MDRQGQRFVAVTMIVLLVVSGGGSGIVAAGSDSQPGKPASFYGGALEANGTEIPAGVEIVAVVNGTVEGKITAETAGQYGGPGAFDDKLRVDSTAGDEVTFRLGGASGSIGGTAALESGITEANLTFPNGTVKSLPPNPAIDIDPNAATAGDSIEFSANGSTAYAGTELATVEWVIERDNETIETFDGEKRNQSLAESGEYDVVLTVTDADGRTETVTSGLEIQADSTDGSIDSGGGDGTSSDSGSSSGGGGGGGDGGTDSSGGGGGSEANSGATNGSGTTEFPRDPVLAETHSIEDRFPNTPGTAVLFGETAIREIRLEGRADGEISIEEFDKPTDNAPPLPDGWRAASASVITVPDDHRKANATLRAVVSEEWLAERGFTPEYLTIYRLPDGGDRWEPLPTETFEIESGYAVEAETPGFSQFVVAGREPPAKSVDEPEQSDTGMEPAADNSEQPSPEEATGEAQSEPTEGQTPKSSETTGFDPTTPLVPLAALGALLVVVAAIGRLFIPRRRDEW